jgi:acetoin utilization deacetylase AcuC-like enzyme
MSKTGFLDDPIFRAHDTGAGHPERAERCDAIVAGLAAAGLEPELDSIKIRAATVDEIALCHARSYIGLVEREVDEGRRILSTGDTRIRDDSYAVAMYAAGGALSAVDAVIAGDVKNAFCSVRPPGHHATRDRGMGFCLFNNAAIAARYAQKRHGLAKVLIADWDVHHGNGTQDIFYDDGSVLYFSTHQEGWYPGTGWADETGAGGGKGTTLNVPFPAGADGGAILAAFEERLAPAADAFGPDLVIVSAGFDSDAADPLGGLMLTADDFAALTDVVAGIARTHCGGRLVSVLEGGYSLDVLRTAVPAHVRSLIDA